MTMTETTITPFTLSVADADLQDLYERLSRTRFAQEIPGAQWDYGVPTTYVQDLVEHAQGEFNWREWEARLNQYPQFTTVIDGQTIHFLHVKSPAPNAFPLLLTHGWPMTVFEFLDVIGPLTDPECHGRPADIAFDLVIPSIPGMGISGPTTERGWNRYRIASAWSELMARLGYERYGLHGNDGGSLISPEVGRLDPHHVAGVHVTQIFSFPSGDPAELKDLTPDEMAGLEVLQNFWEKLGSFNLLQSAQPQTVAHALSDSPAGLLGWMGQLFANDVSKDYVLANVFLYWFTGTAASSIRFYHEDKHGEAPQGPTSVPIGLASFANDFKSIRRFADRDHRNIVQWHEYPVGGHHSAHQVPDVLVDDLRGFFGSLRG
jgi:epoxide hydrolase